jgi:hypothetical protein
MKNEFGPGIYITKVFATAKDYAGLSGAIMVFKYPDLHNLTVWEPNDDEWKLLTAHWLPRYPCRSAILLYRRAIRDRMLLEALSQWLVNGSRTCGYLEKIPSWHF